MSKNTKTDKEIDKTSKNIGAEGGIERKRENIEAEKKIKKDTRGVVRKRIGICKGTQADIRKMSEIAETSKKNIFRIISQMSEERTEDKKYEKDEDDEGGKIKESEGTEEKLNKDTEKYEGNKENKADKQEKEEKIKESEGTEEMNKDTENKKHEGDKEDKIDNQDEEEHIIEMEEMAVGTDKRADTKSITEMIDKKDEKKEDEEDEKDETDDEDGEKFDAYVIEFYGLGIGRIDVQLDNENKENKTAEDMEAEEIKSDTGLEKWIEEFEMDAKMIETFKSNKWRRTFAILEEMEKIIKRTETTEKKDQYKKCFNGCVQYLQNCILIVKEHRERNEKMKKRKEDKTEKHLNATKQIEKVKENIEETQEKTGKYTGMIKKVRKVSEKTKTDEKIDEMSKDIENKKYEKDEEEHVYENYQGGQNIEATREIIKTSENTNIDKKIEEISKKQNKLEEQIKEISEKQNKLEEQNKEMSEKLNKIMLILENKNKQEAMTHKCDKDFKAGEITTADKEEKENTEAAKGITNMIENTEMDKKLKILHEIIKVLIKTIFEIITNAEDKKDKRAEEISAKVIKKLCLLENVKKSIEMYKEDKNLEDYYSKFSAFLESERENIVKEGSTAGKMSVNTNETSIIEKNKNADLSRIMKMIDEIIKKYTIV